MTSAQEYVRTSDAAQYWQSFSPIWRPEPGELIIGTVEHLGQKRALDGVDAPLLRIRLDSGDRIQVFATQTQLLAKLTRLKPAKGDRIKILFERTEPTPGPGMKPTHVYRVRVREGVDVPDPTVAGVGDPE